MTQSATCCGRCCALLAVALEFRLFVVLLLVEQPPPKLVYVAALMLRETRNRQAELTTARICAGLSPRP